MSLDWLFPDDLRLFLSNPHFQMNNDSLSLARASEGASEGREGQKKTPLSADDDDAEVEVDVLIPTALTRARRG